MSSPEIKNRLNTAMKRFVIEGIDLFNFFIETKIKFVFILNLALYLFLFHDNICLIHIEVPVF
jgi:hypothetical protein